MGSMNILPAVPECHIARFDERHEDHFVIPLRLDAASSCCPDCRHASRSVDSRYQRHPADLPLSTSRTTLRIEVLQVYCFNPHCRRRPSQRNPRASLEPHVLRTRQLSAAQARVDIARGAGGALPSAPAHAGQPRDRAAARHLPADTQRASYHPRRHRRLGDPQGPPLRHNHSRPPPPPRDPPFPRSNRTHPGRLAWTALRRSPHRPGLLERVGARREPWLPDTWAPT